MSENKMSQNKATVERYLEGFRRGDHALVLSCLAEDVEWEFPGVFLLKGKEAFDREIENEAFVGHPEITTTRMIEEDNIVAAEGTVRSHRKSGEIMNGKYCDVFVFQDGRIKRLVSYFLMVS